MSFVIDYNELLYLFHQGTAVELMPGCTAILEDNDIIHKAGMELGSEFSSEEELDSQIPKHKGAIHLHVHANNN